MLCSPKEPTLDTLAFGAVSGARLVARQLTLDELVFAWQNNTRSSQNWMRTLTLGAKQLHFHQSRLGNCADNDCYRHRLVTPCLPTPAPEDWLSLLADQHVLFLGDSLLRDVWVYLCAALAHHHIATQPNAHAAAGQHVGVGGAVSMSFSSNRSNATLTLCWYLDHNCRPWERRADLLIAHFGSWEDARLPLMPGSFPAESADNLSSLSPWLADVLSQRMQQRPDSVVWMEYPAPHFPWGTGEYEDLLQLNAQEQLGLRGHLSCRPRAGAVESHVTTRRREPQRIFERAGVPVLKTWDVTVDRYKCHPTTAYWSDTTRGWTKVSRKPYGALDCRHQCVPGEVVAAWERRLFGMLRRQV